MSKSLLQQLISGMTRVKSVEEALARHPDKYRHRRAERREGMKRRERREWMLPDRSMTTNVRKYIREWRSLGANVAEVLGPEWRCFAFEPDIHVGHPREPYIVVERRLALAIQKLVTKKKEDSK